jgi:transaldolase/glucose-6-phosphate isomerase
MTVNPLIKITDYGQSIWLDFIRRHMLTSGELGAMIREDGLRGVTSNPSIFDKAIAGSHDYDDVIREMARARKSTGEIYERLTVADVRSAADLFRPVYEAASGRDGYVSLEVSPHLAHDTAKTIAEAQRLWAELDRPNVMIKVPATREGLPAIETLISQGININVTLLFGLPRYREVAEAYISGLESRLAQGGNIDHIASVASFFVSRIDVLVDPILEKRMLMKEDGEGIAAQAHGEVAISCAKLAYRIYKEVFESPRFRALEKKGAQHQRLLWASTSTKDPCYSDVKYVEALIGPETVNTIPLETLNAYRDHGDPRARLERGVEAAQRVLDRLSEIGIELSEVAQQLEDEGVEKFSKAYDSLIQTLDDKRAKAYINPIESMRMQLGEAEDAYDDRLAQLEQDDVASRIWTKDASLWKRDPQEKHQIQNALGWLHVAEKMVENLPQLQQFAAEIKAAGFQHVVHMGMGGSSLAPLLFARTFPASKSGLPLTILDSTDPATVLGLEKSLPLEQTLFIVASKSGKTDETLAFGEYFYRKVQAVLEAAAGRNFVAITDPGTHLADIAAERGFRKVFLNYPDIGGRYSALSYFGMVPAALAGVDITGIIARARQMLHACSAAVPGRENPGLMLGAALGELALEGRDKVTFVLSESIATLGMWLEQLLAESTGKEGKGLVPVAGEPLGDTSVYGSDRVFVYIWLDDDEDKAGSQLDVLEKAGHPVIRIHMDDLLDLGKEFFRWEFATAVAGSILGINAFNQPNVQESKDNTAQLLKKVEKDGALGEEDPRLIEDGIEIFADKVHGDLDVALSKFLLAAQAGDYVALMAYLSEQPTHESLLQKMRLMIRDHLRVATTLGYGPRFLHSTGQLHKGGPNTGIFLQLTSDPSEDAEIPGEPYTFGLLRHAQFLGDYKALRAHGRRVIRVHLAKNVEEHLEKLVDYMDIATTSLPLANREINREGRDLERVAK